MRKTIKEKILKLLSDGKPRHYSEVADKLHLNKRNVGVRMALMKNEGLLETPIRIIKRNKAGYYKIIKQKCN
jgi:DNA-binding Lrp family transcriptional regulator